MLGHRSIAFFLYSRRTSKGTFMKFTDLNFQEFKFKDGVQAIHFFPNGYGVSVVKHPGSYGFEYDLYEVAILKGTEKSFDLCYDTPIADDVLGHRDENDIEIIMEEVQAL
jgi:hypothetical protein